MIRFVILVGFVLLFATIHQQGELNKYINTKFAYLSVCAMVLLAILAVVELVRLDRRDKAKKREKELVQSGEHAHCCHDHQESVNNAHNHADHSHDHDHAHAHDDFGHTHEPASRWKRYVGYAILIFPIITGVFLPVQTLDSSFVKAKGFAFPSSAEVVTDDTPGEHQFLKPDSSVFYGEEGYEKLKNKELAQFIDMKTIELDDSNYMKGMEVIYNFPGHFMGRQISFDGFAYRGEQIDDRHYFIFRFGFIHCVADSGIFGMLVEFPKGTVLNDDDWIHVSGELTSQLYQPFKQTIPVLRVTEWKPIPQPKDPYVYRNY